MAGVYAVADAGTLTGVDGGCDMFVYAQSFFGLSVQEGGGGWSSSSRSGGYRLQEKEADLLLLPTRRDVGT